MFDTFTIRTVQKGVSAFWSEHSFSLLKLLSPDPLHLLGADEFVVWVALTLLLALLYYVYSLLHNRVAKRLARQPRRTEGKVEALATDKCPRR